MLELAEDPDGPAARAGEVLLDLLVEPRRVLHGARRRPDGAARGGPELRSADGRTPQEALAEIRKLVTELTARQAKLWRRELRPALAEQGIVVGRVEDLASKEVDELADRFERQVFPVLTPLAVGPGQPFPYISGLSL